MKKKPPLVLAHLGGIIFSHLSSYYNAIFRIGLQAKKKPCRSRTFVYNMSKDYITRPAR